MGQEFGYPLRIEIKKLLCFIGVLVAVVLTFQHFELPYGNNTAPFPDGTTQETDNNHGTENPEIVSNDVVTEGSRGLNESSLIKSSEQESSLDQLLDTNANSSTGLFPPNVTIERKEEPTSNITATVVPIESNKSKVDKDGARSLDNDRKSGEKQNHRVTLLHSSKKKPQTSFPAVITISEMNKLQLQRWSYPSSRRPLWPSAADQELQNAKSQIQNAPIIDNDPLLYAPLYRNISMFKMSYELMENILKVYIYKEGDRPIIHQGPLQGIYSSEGWFMKLLEANKRFVTKDSKKAHLFYLPFSSEQLVYNLYVPNSHSHKNLIEYLKNYLDMILEKYPFWNRTGGADHFLVACHDWAPSETKQHMPSCIRALCNADPKEGFILGKDASLPETYVRTSHNPLRDLGGKPASKRSILAFFAGSMHGYLRPILLQHWENKDPDMKIFGRLPHVKGEMNYIRYMKSSKYCICAKGYEVNSPRVVEAIFYECVPVIISDNFVPPFFEVLNWQSFAVFVLEKDIPNLKNILLSIPKKKYRKMQMRVKKVQQHFLWHPKPVKYDMFHMILHSVWYNRVFQMHPT